MAGATGRRRFALVLAPAALLALGLGGLPLTGGALAKLAIKAPLGAELPALLATASAAATTLLVAHWLRCLAASRAEDPSARPSPGLVLPMAVLAVAAVAVPWALFLAVFGGEPAYAFRPAALAEAVLPVAAGLLLAALLAWWRPRLPAVPEGDVLVPAERGLRALAAAWPGLPALAAPAWRDPGGAIAAVAGVERRLQGWPAAVLALLLVAGAVAVAFALGR